MDWLDLMHWLGWALLLAALACACVGWWRAERRARAAERRRAVAEDAHADLCRAVFAGQPAPSSAPVRIQLHPGLLLDGSAQRSEHAI